MGVKYRWLSPLEYDRFKLLKNHSCHEPKKTPPNQTKKIKIPTKPHKLSRKKSNLHIMVGSEYIPKATVFKGVFYYKTIFSYTRSWTDNWKVCLRNPGGRQGGHNFSKLGKNLAKVEAVNSEIPFQSCMPPHHLPAHLLFTSIPNTTLFGIAK